MIAPIVVVTLLFSGLASAQSSNDDDRDDDARHQQNHALAVGVGLVEPAGQTETYFMAALRWRIGGRDDERNRQAASEGITGYLEPEIGYWKSSDDRISGSDLLVGANLIGVVPFGNVDSFFGVGAGAHFVDASVLRDDPGLSGSDTKLGLNAQFGIDIFLNHSLSIFGAGRYDLVQGAKDNIQAKVYLGLRSRF
jgi:hypothetical protein